MSEGGESYLDQLLNSITPSEDEMMDFGEEDALPEEPTTLETTSEELNMTDPDETNSSDEPALEEMLPEPEEEIEVEEPEVSETLEESDEPEILEEPKVSEEPEETNVSEGAEDYDVGIPGDNGEDLSELLGMLADHYEEEQENQEEIQKDMVESSMGMDDVFQDALSAVSYMGNEDEDNQPEMSLDEPSEETISSEELMTPEQIQEEIGETEEEPKKKRKSFKEKYFDNIVDDKEVERELAEREKEAKTEEELAQAKEEKKKKAQEEKEEKERLKEENKEKKKAEKEAKEAEKQRKKAEKLELKRQRQEEEAREVVGRINPVGAAIVVVFFVAIAVVVIFGTRVVSYRSSIHNAEVYFDTGNYEKAYSAMDGVNISDSDLPTYEKVRMCAQLQTQLDACESYLQMGKPLEALDALVKGVKQYDLNADDALKYRIKDKQDTLLAKISEKLMTEFHMTTAEARQILQLETREEITQRLTEKAVTYSN